MRARTLLKTGLLVGAAGIGYAAVIERNWFALREVSVPLLAPGTAPLRVLHISDVHLTPGRHRLLSWLRSLDALEPDLVVNTGDTLAHPQAVEPFLTAIGPLLERPGVFVFGSNDLYSPALKNPLRYLWGPSSLDHDRDVPDLPWRELGDAMESAGWFNANNRRGRIKAGDLDVEVAGVHDPHIHRDRYTAIAGSADPAADLRLGVLHSPEPAALDRFVADGFDLLLAGHTHGGQLRLPGTGALVTNCGIPRALASGLHCYPPDDDARRAAGTAAAAAGRADTAGRGAGAGAAGAGAAGAVRTEHQAWLNVSAGLGTSPTAPARFCCRPEATLLTLVPGIS